MNENTVVAEAVEGTAEVVAVAFMTNSSVEEVIDHLAEIGSQPGHPKRPEAAAAMIRGVRIAVEKTRKGR
jgi:hypothetical protein